MRWYAYWAEVRHRRQIEHILDERLGMILLWRIKDCHTFSHVVRVVQILSRINEVEVADGGGFLDL